MRLSTPLFIIANIWIASANPDFAVKYCIGVFWLVFALVTLVLESRRETK